MTVRSRGWLSAIGQEGTAGIVLRTALLLVSLILLPTLLSSVGLPAQARQVVIPVSGAVLIAATYLWRPAEALFAMAVFMMFSETTAWYIGAPIKRLDEVSLLLLAPIAAWRALPRWRSWVWWPRDLPIAAAVLAGLISSLAAHVPVGVWVPAGLLLAKAIIFFYIVMLSHVSATEARAGLWVVIAAGVAVAVLGVIELFNPNGFQEFLHLNHYVRLRSENVVVKSVFVHPALFGYFTTFVALLTLARYLVTRQLRWLFVSLFVATGPFLSARRRAILALTAGAIAALVASPRVFRSWSSLVRTWIPAAAGGVVLFVLFLSLLTGLYDLTLEKYGIGVPGLEPTPSPGEVIVEPPGEGENARARVALYEGSVEIARDYLPLGGGMGRFGSWMSRQQYSPLYTKYGLDTVRGLKPPNPTAATDTFWPQILGEMGVIGLLGYAAFLAALGWMLWREVGRDDGQELRILRLAAGMLFAQALVESLASSMFNSPSRVYLMVLVIGIVASIAWQRPREAEA
jgi:O-Antigen ligase